MTPPRQVEHASVRSPAIGITAAFAAAAIAAGWQVATRAGLTAGGVTPIDLALFRYGMPALVLLPLLVRNGLWPSAASRWLALPLCVGGLPFGLLAMCGAQLAPVAHMGALLPGTMPLFTALLAWLLLSERLAPRQMAGFLVVSLGIALITHKSLAGFGPSTLTGDLLFLLAALAWAVFTITFRVAGIPPWHAAALISLASALVALPLWFATGTERLLAASPEDLLWLVTMQGLLAGLAGFWTFAVAVRHLGAIGAAVSGALVPVLATLGGALFLSETPGKATMLGIGATVFGIVAVAWPRHEGNAQRMATGQFRRPA
jgi:drug/metabolite transporter (DMT)-like permease